MAVSKRTRYEVLRRDNHTCRYCGARAPEAKLAVDHVVPVALGGHDGPQNLVAACEDCNQGKASTSPDAVLIADVAQEDLDRMLQRAELWDAIREHQQASPVEWLTVFESSWQAGPLPTDWRNTITRWYLMGVPWWVLQNSYEDVVGRRLNNHYACFCGKVWGAIKDLNALEARLPDQQIAKRVATAWREGYVSASDRLGGYAAQYLTGLLSGDDMAYYDAHVEGWLQEWRGVA